MARLSLPKISRSRKKKAPVDGAQRPDLKSQLTRLRTALRRRWQVTLVLGIVISSAMYFMLIRPANTELTSIRAEVVVAERRAKNLREEFAALQSAEGAAAASARFDRAMALDTLLPRNLTNQDILQAITPLVSSAGLTLGESVSNPELSPGPSEGLQYRSFSVTVSGDFPQIVKFLEALYDAEPLVSVFGATFTYIPASAANNTPARTELTAELRFWSSNLELIRDIKLELDNKRREDQGLDPLPPTTTPPSTLAPSPTTTAAGASASSATPVPAPDTSSTTAPTATTVPTSSAPAASTTTPPPTTQSVSISPGAFCSPEGATGTYRGQPYICSLTDKSGKPYIDGRAHWREQT